MKYRNSVFTALLSVSAGWWSGCAGVPSYSTAKTVKEGHLQLMPYFTNYFQADNLPYDPPIDNDPPPEESGIGVAAVYGLTDRLDLMGSYEWLEYRDEPGNDHARFAMKYALKPGRQAFSVGTGFYRGLGYDHFDVSFYANLYFKKRIYYCVAPTIFFSAPPFFYGTLNNSVTFELGKWFIRPELGVGILSIFGHLSVNAGLAAGVTF